MRRALLTAVVLTVLTVSGCSGTSDDGTDTKTKAATSADATASPTSADDWYAKAEGTFSTIKKSGTGNASIELPKDMLGGILHVKYDGEGDFALNGLDDTKEVVDPLLETTGAYQGDLGVGLAAYGRPVTLDVKAAGDWTLSLEPLVAAPVAKLPLEGTTSAVYRFDGTAGTWSLGNTGTGPFQVTQYAHELPNQLANLEGAGQVAGSAFDGPSVLVVKADGPWTITQG